MSKYDIDTFIKRTMWWRISNSIVLALLSLTLIFTNQTISNYGEATQRHLRVLHEKIDNLQRKVDAIESLQPSAPQANQSPTVGPSPQNFTYGDLQQYIQGVKKATEFPREQQK